jgi:hypothetical protein
MMNPQLSMCLKRLRLSAINDLNEGSGGVNWIQVVLDGVQDLAVDDTAMKSWFV